MKLADIKLETQIPSKLTHDPVKDVTFEIKYKSSLSCSRILRRRL